MYHYKATVKRVIDGDTVDLITDLGFGVSKLVRVRLAGIDAPEVRGEQRPEGLASKTYLELLLPVGTAVEMFTQKDKGAGWGRYVGDIYTVTPEGLTGISITDEMVEAGHAGYKTYD